LNEWKFLSQNASQHQCPSRTQPICNPPLFGDQQVRDEIRANEIMLFGAAQREFGDILPLGLIFVALALIVRAVWRRLRKLRSSTM